MRSVIAGRQDAATVGGRPRRPTAARCLRALCLGFFATLLVACDNATGPDGASASAIAFAVWGSGEGRGLYVQSRDSGSVAIPVETDRAVMGLDWSPDGRYITYSMGTGVIRVVDIDHRPDARAVVPAGDGIASYPTWSPDGSRIAYVRAGVLWVVGASDGSAPINLSQTSVGDVNHPDWSPDGTQIVYEWGHSLLWIAEADGSGFHRIGVSEPDSLQQPIYGYAPRWSPDGARIAFYNTGVWTIAVDASDRRAVTPNCDDAGACGREGVYYAPEWSPDGSRLVLSGRDYPDSPTARIYVVNADGTGLRQLTDGHADGEPQWSPDGSQILFLRHYPMDVHQVFVVGWDGTGERPVTRSAWHVFARWRPPPGAR